MKERVPENIQVHCKPGGGRSAEGSNSLSNGGLCVECGVTGDFCGYHGIRPKEVSLCVACAEQQIDVWVINLEGQIGGGIVTSDLKEAQETITVIMDEMAKQDIGDVDAYTISKKQMSRLQVMSLPEFQGF